MSSRKNLLPKRASSLPSLRRRSRPAHTRSRKAFSLSPKQLMAANERRLAEMMKRHDIMKEIRMANLRKRVLEREQQSSSSSSVSEEAAAAARAAAARAALLSKRARPTKTTRRDQEIADHQMAQNLHARYEGIPLKRLRSGKSI